MKIKLPVLVVLGLSALSVAAFAQAADAGQSRLKYRCSFITGRATA
jgi:hypothetical protein